MFGAGRQVFCLMDTECGYGCLPIHLDMAKMAALRLSNKDFASIKQLLQEQIKKSSVCPLFLPPLLLSVCVYGGRLAALMEMPAVWVLTPHQVHLLK